MASTKKKKRKASPESPHQWYADPKGNILINVRWARQNPDRAFSEETVEEMRRAAERQVNLGSGRLN